MARKQSATFRKQARVIALVLALAHLLAMLIASQVEAVGLTIAKGVEVRSGVAGQLVARDPVTIDEALLTGDTTVGNPGDWLGVLMFGSATGSKFTGTTIDFAGGGGAALDLRGASPTLSGITVRNSGGIGIRVTDKSAPVITDAIISGNSVGLETAGGANPTLRNS